MKTKPTSQVELLRQLIFNNPLMTNVVGRLLGVNRFNESRAIVKVGCTKMKDLRDQEDKEWKSLPTLEMNSHVINRTSRDIIISSILWDPVTFFQTGNWISNKTTGHPTPLTWIYRVTKVLSHLVKAIKFRRIPPSGLTRVMSFQEVTLSPEGYHLVKVLS